MKRISLLKIMAFGVLALVHTACENAKYDVIDNLVYINEASTSKTKELTLTEGTTRTSLTVRLVNIINQTIKANLFIDESVLDAYNNKNETNYKMPPKEYISFPESVTIEAGSVSADPVNVDIKSFEAEGGDLFVFNFRFLSVDLVFKTILKISATLQACANAPLSSYGSVESYISLIVPILDLSNISDLKISFVV